MCYISRSSAPYAPFFPILTLLLYNYRSQQPQPPLPRAIHKPDHLDKLRTTPPRTFMSSLPPALEFLVSTFPHPKLKKQFPGVCHLVVTQDADTHHDLTIQAGEVALSAPSGGKCDLRITLSLVNFEAIMSGKLKPPKAFMEKKIKIKGKVGLAMKFQRVVDAVRKAQRTSKL